MLTCMARAAPVCFKTIRLVCRDAQAAANAPALEMLAEARATFNRLIAEVHPINVATLSTLQYKYGDSGSEDSGSDSGSETWENVTESFDKANSELIEHQDSVCVWRARELLLDVQGRAGFLTSARSMLHVSASSSCTLPGVRRTSAPNCPSRTPPPDLSLMDYWEDNGFLKSTLRLIDRRHRKADLQAVYAGHGISPELRAHIDRSWCDTAAILTACKRAGLTAPPDCDSWDRLQRDAPRVIEEARRSWTQFHQHVQRRAREQREEVARARRTACLHHAIRKMGLSPRADSALQRSCVVSAHSMHLILDKTLRCAVWMHWLHSHTHGKYMRAVEYEKDASRGSDSDSEYGLATAH